MASKNTFNDAGDGTCMDCGRSRANCYCSIPFDDDNHMLDIDFIKVIKKNYERVGSLFHAKCELIIFEIPKNPIRSLGINNGFALNQEFAKIITSIEKINAEKINNIFYFQEKLDRDTKTREIIPSISIYKFIQEIFEQYTNYFDETDNLFFKYVIIEFPINNNDREKITHLLSKSLLLLLFKFGLTAKIYNRYLLNSISYLDFHAICQGIYFSYSINDRSQEKIKKITVNKKIEAPKEHLLIKDFILYVNNSIDVIFNDTTFLHSAKFLLQDEQEYKDLREELIVIKSYILHKKIDDNITIELGGKKERWDAKILLKDGTELLIEVTQAFPRMEHLTRHVLAVNMHDYKSFSLKLRTIHQQGIDSFPQPIIDSIEKKHKKEYTEPRILIVIVLAEFACNDSYILTEWFYKIKKETSLGNFKEIYLAIDAENLYQLH